MDIVSMKNKIFSGYQITREEALALYYEPLEKLSGTANEIREYFCGTSFDICTIINAKSGKCSEDCKYCAQSSFYHTGAEKYSLLDADDIAAQAKYNCEQGVLRYSLVTSGRCLADYEIDIMCKTVEIIRKKTNISVCVSFGLLGERQFQRLKSAGVSRIHNNLETSRSFFPNICTTHTFDDKIAAIKAAQRAGLTVCSGGIMGLGETFADRIELALTIRELNICSVPVNILNPIPGTPYENSSRLTDGDVRRIIAVFRCILPDASIRLAGGRGLLADKGKSCFMSGANAAISGDMLTTAGISIESDMNLLKELNFKAEMCNG